MRKQQGFTLIELLVVIAILGVIAAVVGLNVNNFFGSGTVQAANAEAHQVQTAISAYMADAEITSFNGTIGPASNYPEGSSLDEGVHKYLYGELQADYAVVDGTVVNATPVSTGKWKTLHFCGTTWQSEPCT